MPLRPARSRRLALPLLAALACGACAALTESTTDAGPAADAPLADASPTADAEPPEGASDAAPPPDRGAPPLDSVCPEWAEKVTPVTPGVACDARRRMPIDTGVLTRRLGVAVTDSGRVAVGYGVYTFDSASDLRLTHFGAATPSLTDKATAAVGNGLSNEWGDAVAVAAGEGDEVHVVSNDFDVAPRGQVVYRRFAGGALGPPSVVTTNVPRGAPLAIPGVERLQDLYDLRDADLRDA